MFKNSGRNKLDHKKYMQKVPGMNLALGVVRLLHRRKKNVKM